MWFGGGNKYSIGIDLNEQMLGFLHSRLRSQMQSHQAVPIGNPVKTGMITKGNVKKGV